jgi:hypothetical protein
VPPEIPSSLASLLSLFRPCFTQPTFQTFCVLSIGLWGRVRSRTVTGMLVASGRANAWHHSRAHRFFSRARWSVDRLGLIALELISSRLLTAGAPLCLAIDDTLIKRFGRKVFGRCLNYEGSSSAAPGKRTAFGNSWVVAGVVVELAFLDRAICLPVLFRLWRPRQGPTQVALAAELVRLIALRDPERRLLVLADGAYAGAALAPKDLPDNATLILRGRRDIRLRRPPPQRLSGARGRPRLCGEKLPGVRQLAGEGCHWRRARVSRYGKGETVTLLEQRGLWYRTWGATPVKVVALGDHRAEDGLEAVLICSDPKLAAERIVELYAKRWSIEVAFRDAKQLIGVGEAQNRSRAAVERTAPFGFLCLTMAIVWYALAGHAPGDVAERRARAPWYRTKHQPSVEDMLVKLRRSIIAARFSVAMGPQARGSKIASLAEALEMAGG